MNYTLVQHFARLYDHRTFILEGMRVAAFRNVGHLFRAMKREGIDTFTTPASLIRVQDTMIRDQGLEPTPTRRWLLSCGTFNAWEVYLCLLFTEVESYRSTRSSFAFLPLDELIDQSKTVLDALKAMRDKLLHPTKDVPYDTTLLQYFRQVERRYPTHFFFGKDIQILLDQYLRNLRDHLAATLSHDVARLPDNQLHSFVAGEARDLRRALAQADSTIDKEAIGKLLRDHEEFIRGLRLDPARRSDPLDVGQRNRIRRLHDVMKLLYTKPLPTTAYHSPTAVQASIHASLSSCIPIPPELDTKGFYRGSLLPPPLNRARRDHATLVFRSTLLMNESLHDADVMLNDNFPGKSRSEIQEIEDWPTRLAKPTTLEDIAAVARWDCTRHGRTRDACGPHQDVPKHRLG